MNELKPKPDKSSYINQNPSDIINIAFKAGSRYNDVILTIPGNITIREMFQRYVEKLGISQNAQDNLMNAYGSNISNLANQNNTDAQNYANWQQQVAANENSKKGLFGRIFG